MKFFADDSKMYAEITDIADVIIIIIHEFHRDANLEQNFRAAMCHRHVLHYSCNVMLLWSHGYKPPWTAWYSGLRQGS